MCLITEDKKPNIATTDLYVYKVLLKTIYKPYKLLPFYKKIKYTTPIYEATVKKGCILKASSPDSTIKRFNSCVFVSYYYIGEQGVHAFIKAADAKYFNHVNKYKGVITLWKIPINTKYWINSTKDTIAATKMQFIKILY